MGKYDVVSTGRFKKELKRALKRGMQLSNLYEVVDCLGEGRELPAKHRNHLLHGDYKGFWECHITPDWLLIYEKSDVVRVITLQRTGTHSDLFG